MRLSLLLPFLLLAACSPPVYAPNTLTLPAVTEQGHVEATAQVTGSNGVPGYQYGLVAAPTDRLLFTLRAVRENEVMDASPAALRRGDFYGRRHRFWEGAVGVYGVGSGGATSMSFLLGLGRGESTSWGDAEWDFDHDTPSSCRECYIRRGDYWRASAQFGFHISIAQIASEGRSKLLLDLLGGARLSRVRFSSLTRERLIRPGVFEQVETTPAAFIDWGAELRVGHRSVWMSFQSALSLPLQEDNRAGFTSGGMPVHLGLHVRLDRLLRPLLRPSAEDRP